jgi:hypothetical protein
MDIFKLYLDGKSIPQISEQVKISYHKVRAMLKEKGILRSRAEALRLAGKQGRLSKRKGVPRPPFSNEWKKNISEAKKGIGLGLSKKKNGYLEITMGENKGRGEHCVLMEKKICRKLFSNEVVHHINGIRHDNRIENLELMTRSEHARHHALENNNLRERNERGHYK